MESIGDSARASRGRQARRVPTVSRILSDGRVLEMVQQRDVTSFAVWNGSSVELLPEVTEADGRTLVPYSATNNLLAHGVVKLAGVPEEYGSEASLLAGVQGFIHRYVDLTPRFERIAALYVLLTWVFDSFNELPYLRVRGEPGTGKTRFLLTVGALCYKPIFASGASTVSPLFRILDAMGGTLVIDESDFRLSDEKAEVVKILNNGNVRGFPVLRTEQTPGSREFNPRAYHVFGPKIIATRGFFDDKALESRFLSEHMSTDRLRDDIPISLTGEHEAESSALRSQLLMYRFRNRSRVRAAVAGDTRLSPRLRQVFAPLLALATDEPTRRELLELAGRYDAELFADRSMETEAYLLGVISELEREAGRLPSLQEIVDRFLLRHGLEHPNITVRRIGWLLRKRLGIGTVKSHGTYAIVPESRAKLGRLYARYGVESGSPSGIESPESPESPSVDEARGTRGTSGTS